ncbi:MAG: LysE family transporter [Spirochaetales bacterium]|nr:LysE family transporter [Spirochaetales bacterium]
METIIILIKAILTGLMAGFPAGPLGAITIGEMIQGRIKSAFIKGMGAVTANFIYGLVITFGIGFISKFLIEYQNIIRMAGALFVILLGLSILFSKTYTITDKKISTPLPLGRSFITGFVIALTNPSKIFIYSGLISFWGLDAVNSENIVVPLLVAAGIACGSFLWWLFFALTAKKIKKKSGDHKSPKLNILLGILLILLGLYFFTSSLVNLLNAS